MNKDGEAGRDSGRRMPTSTSRFGVSRRESHDATAFYERFEPPIVLDSQDIAHCAVPDQIFCGDSRSMAALSDNCIALVVTSPPYFAGKEYEATGLQSVPESYSEYLAMLRDVFAECWRVLEPGGRIAVNVANLGRKPYRSLSSDVARLLADELGFLLRGEVVWVKAKGSNGSCAWGSYGSATNPVFRDVTERIVVACKGRFDRALSKKAREAAKLPYEDTIDPENFRAWTLDTWYFPPESARRVGHPAPFPVELPRRMIELNTFVGDVILDPFMGAGQTALACLATRRHYVGYDLDASYVELANRRVAEAIGRSERVPLEFDAPRQPAAPGKTRAVRLPARLA